MQPAILDVDPGVDDALAIILALRSPELEILGVSTVCGNVPVAQATINALQIMELMERPDIPVYAGADHPLKRTPVHAGQVHGKLGLGEACLPKPRTVPQGQAVDFLIDILASRPGEVVVIATGPLTNLALAEVREPGILDRARRVLVMGGALLEPGNVTPVAEFNFFVDPHAAQQIVQLNPRLTLVPLDVTRKAVLVERAMVAAGGRGDPIAAFCEAAARTAIAQGENTTGVRGMCLHDPLVVGLACDPGVCILETCWIEIETEGASTSGQVVFDRRQRAAGELPAGVPVQCATGIDCDLFMGMFYDRVFGGSAN